MPVITGTSGNDRLIGTTSADEIMALAGADSLDGGAGNDLLDGGTGADTMVGGTGDDVFVVDDVSDVVRELAGGGLDGVRTTLNRYTLKAEVENLRYTGTGDFRGIGNAGDNKITGAAGNDQLGGGDGADQLKGDAGNDILDGGLGADAMIGGAGNDTYYIDHTGDVLTELAGEGTDSVNSTVRYTVAAGLENLRLLDLVAKGAGNELNNVITGNDAANAISGFAGDDALLGGRGADSLIGGDGNDLLDGGLGSDTMVGGLGDDTYYVDEEGDVVSEEGGSGIDTVMSIKGHNLREGVENLTLVGIGSVTGRGNDLNNIIIGNEGNNKLLGASGDDTLKGGAGDDTLIGGLGRDVLEGGVGIDSLIYSDRTVRVQIDFSEGQVIIDGMVEDTISGIERFYLGSGNDIFSAWEDSVDYVSGGAGDDYIAAALGANISGGDGRDVIELNAVASDGGGTIEGGQGTDAASFFGGRISVILGREGRATAGSTWVSEVENIEFMSADATLSFASYDGYAIAVKCQQARLSLNFSLFEGPVNVTDSGGDRTRVSSGASVLALIDQTDNIATTAVVGSRFDDIISIQRPVYSDMIGAIFSGGLGNDYLRGRLHQEDHYIFDTQLDGLRNVDRIFVSTSDKIILDQDIFSSIGTGGLSATAFADGPSARDASDRIVYDSATGRLYYDADGTGTIEQIQFATLDAGTILDHSYFSVM